MTEEEVEQALDAAEALQGPERQEDARAVQRALLRMTTGHTRLIRGVLVQRGLDAGTSWSLGPRPGGNYWTWCVITHTGSGASQRRVYGPHVSEIPAARAVLREALRRTWFASEGAQGGEDGSGDDPPAP